jgi:hypothetical protein
MFACGGKRTSENATRTGLLQLKIQHFNIEQFALLENGFLRTNVTFVEFVFKRFNVIK